MATSPISPGVPRLRGGFWPLWLGAVLLPLAGFALGAWVAWQEVTEEARARVVRTVDMLHEHALRAFETQETMLTAADAYLAGLGWDEIASSEQVHRFLGGIVGAAPFAGSLGVVDPAGRMVAVGMAGFFPFAPVDQRDRDYVRAHQEGHRGTFTGAMVVTRPAGDRVFPLSRARSGPGGAPDGGVVVAAFRAAAFSEFYARIAESADDVVSLLRLDGAVLARYPEPPHGPMRVPGTARTLTAARDEARAGGVLWSTSPVDGATRLVGFRRVEGYPVVVYYGLGPAALQAAWQGRVWMLGAVLLTAALLLLALTALAARAAGREARALGLAAAKAEQARAEAEARVEAEQRLRQAERSAALGQVATGVAHDMNNLVQTVLATGQLLGRRADRAEEVRRLAGLLGDSARRGQRLAHRMLEFSRPGARGETGFEVERSLFGLEDLLGGLLGSGVRLVPEVAPGLPPAAADRAEFETVLVNLLVNARDAMPDGGRIRVTAELADSGPAVLRRPGPWLRVCVADTGKGMTQAVLQRAGEPFFTTKPPGQGTGLGLMMARQFAERAGGALDIESLPGAGTRVTLWLPVIPAEVPAPV